MPPFRFNIPFFSYGSPSRLSSGTSSPSPPPTPPTPSRPPFRPGGIAQPSKPATSLETKPKVPPSLSRVKSNVAAIAASSSVSQLPSSKTAQEQLKRKETEKLTVEENKKVLRKDMEESSKTAQEQHKRRETEKLAVENKKKVLRKDMDDNSKTAHEQQKIEETEKLAVEEEKKILRKDMEENSKTAQEQQKKKETDKLSAEEKKNVLRKDMQEDSKTAHEQQKKKETEKLAAEESRAPKTVGREDATQSKTIRHIAAASESTGGPRDLPDRKTQNRTEIHTNENHQNAKGESTSNHGNSRVTNREGSSSMSRRVKEDIRDGISKLTWGKSNGDEKSVSVFTLTGENRGATMAIGSQPRKPKEEEDPSKKTKKTRGLGHT